VEIPAQKPIKTSPEVAQLALCSTVINSLILAQLGGKSSDLATVVRHCNREGNLGMWCNLANIVEWSDKFQSDIYDIHTKLYGDIICNFNVMNDQCNAAELAGEFGGVPL